MTESEFLRRIDHHLRRADQHMERGNEIMERSSEIMADANEIHRDHREFIREINVRQERVTERLVRQIDANTDELIAGRGVLEDISLATRQHTQALARILDRMD